MKKYMSIYKINKNNLVQYARLKYVYEHLVVAYNKMKDLGWYVSYDSKQYVKKTLDKLKPFISYTYNGENTYNVSISECLESPRFSNVYSEANAYIRNYEPKVNDAHALFDASIRMLKRDTNESFLVETDSSSFIVFTRDDCFHKTVLDPIRFWLSVECLECTFIGLAKAKYDIECTLVTDSGARDYEFIHPYLLKIEDIMRDLSSALDMARKIDIKEMLTTYEYEWDMDMGLFRKNREEYEKTRHAIIKEIYEVLEYSDKN